MKVIYNNLIPFDGFCAMNLFGVLFVRRYCEVDDVTYNHEAIHTAQMKELGYIPFYILYLIEWFVRLFTSGNAYRSISFEQEAYEHEKDLDYLKTRKPYTMWKTTKD